jgi:hypothetical protein
MFWNERGEKTDERKERKKNELKGFSVGVIS